MSQIPGVMTDTSTETLKQGTWCMLICKAFKGALCSNTALAQANSLMSWCWMLVLSYWTILWWTESSKALVIIKRFLSSVTLLVVKWLNRMRKRDGLCIWQVRTPVLTHAETSQHWHTLRTLAVRRLQCQNRGMLANFNGIRCNNIWRQHQWLSTWIKPYPTSLCCSYSFDVLPAALGVCTGSTSSEVSIFIWMLYTL